MSTEKEAKEKHESGIVSTKHFIDIGAKKRKDPKNMTTEELEEYISKNKVDNKSVNSSFHSQKNLNYSFTAKVPNIENNLNGENLSKNFANLNYNYLNSTNQMQNNNANSVNNPFLQNNSYAIPAKHNQTFHKVEYTQENSSFDNTSDGEEKCFKNKLGNYSSTNNDRSASVSNMNRNQNHQTSQYPSPTSEKVSNATSNYLKSLQDKNRTLLIENEDLKKNFIEVSELLEKDRHDFQKKLINEVNKATEMEKSLKLELDAFENENKMLVEEVNELRMKLTFLNSNISILESEKGRHLEQNAVEKDDLQNQVDNLYREVQNAKNKLAESNEENEEFRNKLNKKNEEVSALEKSFHNIKEDNCRLQRTLDDEKHRLTNNIKSLKEMIGLHEAEKRDMTKKYEKNIRELTNRLNRLEKDSIKLKDHLNKPNKVPIKTPQVSKSIGIKSRSQSKEKLTTSGSSNNLKNSRDMKLQKSPVITKRLNINPVDSYVTTPLSPTGLKSKKKILKKKKKSFDSNRNNLKLSQQSNLSQFTERELNLLSPINKTYHDDLSINSITNMRSPNQNFEIKFETEVCPSTRLREVNNSIFELERNIVELNRNYKNLMIKLNSSISPEEANNIKRKINILATNLQDQSEKLMSLKNQQQEYLKISLRK